MTQEALRPHYRIAQSKRLMEAWITVMSWRGTYECPICHGNRWTPFSCPSESCQQYSLKNALHILLGETPHGDPRCPICNGDYKMECPVCAMSQIEMARIDKRSLLTLLEIGQAIQHGIKDYQSHKQLVGSIADLLLRYRAKVESGGLSHDGR